MQALTLTLTLPPPALRIFEQVLVSRHQPLPQREAYTQPGVCSQRVTQPGSLPTKSTGVSPQYLGSSDFTGKMQPTGGGEGGGAGAGEGGGEGEGEGGGAGGVGDGGGAGVGEGGGGAEGGAGGGVVGGNGGSGEGGGSGRGGADGGGGGSGGSEGGSGGDKGGGGKGGGGVGGGKPQAEQPLHPFHKHLVAQSALAQGQCLPHEDEPACSERTCVPEAFPSVRSVVAANGVENTGTTMRLSMVQGAERCMLLHALQRWIAT